MSFCGSASPESFQQVSTDVRKGRYSMTCVFLDDTRRQAEGEPKSSDCANESCGKAWHANQVDECPFCGHPDVVWWAMWKANMEEWMETGQKGYFVYNAEQVMGQGQKREKAYLDEKGFEPIEYFGPGGRSGMFRRGRRGKRVYEMVSVEEFEAIRKGKAASLKDLHRSR